MPMILFLIPLFIKSEIALSDSLPVAEYADIVLSTAQILFGDAVGADGKLEVHGMDKLVNTEHICETI